ncbi:PhzF family phenazine biosynthesis protein [Desulfobaculum xiamenense]|uniref:PhzF family phenazine biosynthesis protein n=1 Tax=Desulfobaculum xiamenense TaxID=995050 RepID=A0A846QLS7_9BACT|nr:PhzF family isomerase [Desulfobaculum xiamenense]NJB66395.1 PhzF family phenazine biosynthesis protein [Desulfobaculum xiamenense]
MIWKSLGLYAWGISFCDGWDARGNVFLPKIAFACGNSYSSRMNRNITVELVDAFTSTPGKGNRAGVVLDATGLSEAEMQAVAALVNVSETAFMIPTPEAADHELHIRYFTPTTEVPTCGHATVGAHHARARALGLADVTVFAKIGAGILPVDIVGSGEDMKVVMTQGEVVFSPPYGREMVDRILAALGLEAADLLPDLPVQEVSTGHSKVMVPIRSEDKLDSLTPDMAALVECSRAIRCNGFFVFTLNGPDAQNLTSGRMFAPAIGIDEDPVTGNGNGPCGAYLSLYGKLPAQDTFRYCGRQGVAMGREGIIEVTVHRRNGRPYKVQIGGVAVGSGRMDVLLMTSPEGAVTATKV